MGRKTRSNRYKKIIQALSDRYPAAFSLTPYKVLPLHDGIYDEIFHDLGRIPPEYKKRIAFAVWWHRNRTSYLRAIAFGEHYRNLAGNRLERPSVESMRQARDELIRRGEWSKRMEKLHKVNTGRKNAANR
ncbi:hypothetical protein ACEWQ7_004088 [Salmonella enterica]|uniref:ProQ/FinO domain-containing protein n=1 Tax=Salmonella enterica TaxID=28901 RepID=A0A5U4CYN1_SALER|nr:hypothetical protein [Salmonella enterica subsp. enterica]EBP8539433.1 hypothetical protein [Salmonella enterica]EBT4151651.1 hypothetical protein [Salmonella enterica subsp. enterica]EED9463778.1 hypothetical protein [Salmonella enterica subsp. enterica serovar Abaetetuba]EEN6707967.1 hypothetical protein [Salmonella enterica subsp. enterica serovar Rubislaw]